ncbi:hypothetical protein ACHHYP_05389 [Achlya hypogyna]|uniref:Uncharacterized protein n=1 Tax=Achlya hypogyna TaxID=1202772 RepID=A0A1V9YXZ2_ACHHY|nr:hypothetical protein ACHHYP_05389 [Achlya hypogyna]
MNLTINNIQQYRRVQPFLQFAAPFDVGDLAFVVVCPPELLFINLVDALALHLPPTAPFALLVDSGVDILCVQLPRMPIAMESPLAPPHLLADSSTTVTAPLSVTALWWYHPVSLEPVAAGSSLLAHVRGWMALGEALQEDDLLLALALFRGCFYTNVHHHGRQATATLEAQVAVGDCLAQLHQYTDAIEWLTDVMSHCDADDVTLRDCMALLGMVHLQRQEVTVARTLFERVALLDELDAGPADLATLESMLNVAAAYRYGCNYAPAMVIVTSVITTARANGADAIWQGVIQSGRLVLGLLLCSTGDSDQGCEYLYDAFRWRLEYFGVDHARTWSAFSAWYWCSEQAGRWVLSMEAQRLVAAVTIMPPTIGDWPGKACVACAGAIAGAAFAPAAAAPYTYLRCKGCVGLDVAMQECCPARRHPAATMM